MSTTTWRYFVNFILAVTEGSYKLAVKVSLFHYNALSTAAADGDILAQARLPLYKPLHTALLTAYTDWQSQQGTQESKTLNVAQLLALLSSSKINSWDIAIQGVYDKKSPAYKNLLPDGRYPFQNGGGQSRLTSLQSLDSKVAIDPAFANTIKAPVHTFYTQLDAAIANQQQSKSGTTGNSTAVEAARVAMCVAQFSNYGAFIEANAATPSDAERFFDEKSLRSHEQSKFTEQHLPAGDTHLVVEHTFAPGDQVRVRNTGGAPLHLFLYPVNTYGTPPAKPYVLLPNEDKTIDASNLGPLTDTFLYVQNAGATEGGWRLDIL